MTKKEGFQSYVPTPEELARQKEALDSAVAGLKIESRLGLIKEIWGVGEIIRDEERSEYGELIVRNKNFYTEFILKASWPKYLEILEKNTSNLDNYPIIENQEVLSVELRWLAGKGIEVAVSSDVSDYLYLNPENKKIPQAKDDEFKALLLKHGYRINGEGSLVDQVNRDWEEIESMLLSGKLKRCDIPRKYHKNFARSTPPNVVEISVPPCPPKKRLGFFRLK